MFKARKYLLTYLNLTEHRAVREFLSFSVYGTYRDYVNTGSTLQIALSSNQTVQKKSLPR